MFWCEVRLILVIAQKISFLKNTKFDGDLLVWTCVGIEKPAILQFFRIEEKDTACMEVFVLWIIGDLLNKMQNFHERKFSNVITCRSCNQTNSLKPFDNQICVDFAFQIQADLAFLCLVVEYNFTLLFCLIHFTSNNFMKIMNLQIRWRNVVFLIFEMILIFESA